MWPRIYLSKLYPKDKVPNSAIIFTNSSILHSWRIQCTLETYSFTKFNSNKLFQAYKSESMAKESGSAWTSSYGCNHYNYKTPIARVRWVRVPMPIEIVQGLPRVGGLDGVGGPLGFLTLCLSTVSYGGIKDRIHEVLEVCIYSISSIRNLSLPI